MLCYFDSSILLAILLDEKRKPEAKALWNEATVRVSSILLKLETVFVLRRTYEHNKNKLDPGWITKKATELTEYLQETNTLVIDEDIVKAIVLKKEISRCKTLDAIHIATALEFRKLVPSSDFYFYTYDKGMADLAKAFRFKINQSRNEDFF